MKKKKVKTSTEVVTPEVMAPSCTWNDKTFMPALVTWRKVSPSLDSVGRILYFHQLAIESGKVSIAAALMVALELHKVRSQHQHDWMAWCEANLNTSEIKFGYTTAMRYLKVLNKTVGRTTNLYMLANATDEEKLNAVATYTKYTNYQSLYQIYQGEGIVAKSNLGGGRENAGRKHKGEATADEKHEEEVVTLDEIANTPSVLWGLCRDPLHKLNDLQRERHFIERLEFIEFSEVYSILKGLYEAAAKTMKRLQKEGCHA